MANKNIQEDLFLVVNNGWCPSAERQRFFILIPTKMLNE